MDENLSEICEAIEKKNAQVAELEAEIAKIKGE